MRARAPRIIVQSRVVCNSYSLTPFAAETPKGAHAQVVQPRGPSRHLQHAVCFTHVMDLTTSCRIRRTRGSTPPRCNKYPLHCNVSLLHFSLSPHANPRVSSPHFLGRCGVHCNFVLLHARPRGTPAHRQEQHDPHKHIIILPLAKPIPFASTGTSAPTDRRASYGYAHFHKLCGTCQGLPKLSLRNVFLRGFVNMWWTFRATSRREQLFVVPKISSQTESCTGFYAVRRTVGGSVEVRVSRQNPAADSRTDLWHPSSSGSGGTRRGLHSYLPGWGSTAFCGADF